MYFSNKPLVVGFLLLFTLAQGLHATEILGGKLQKNTILSPENGAYLVSQDLIVPEGITLTITPGTELQFMYGVSLHVDRGILISEGTKDNPITFSAYDNNMWEGINVSNSSTCLVNGGQLSGTRLSYVKILDAINGLLLINSSSVIAQEVVVSRCNYGIKVDLGASIKLLSSTIDNCLWGFTINKSDNNELRNCQISDCQFAIYFSSDPSRYNTIANNNISHNKIIGVFLNNSQGEVQYNKISGNKISFNDIGLHIGNDGSRDCGYNSIVDNEIKNNTSHGIKLTQDCDTIMYNKLEGNKIGLELKSSNNNVIKNNFIKLNTGWAILLFGSSASNIIEQNNIIENNQGVRIFPDKDAIPINNRLAYNTLYGNLNELISIESGPQQKFEFNTLLATKHNSFINLYNGRISAINNYWGTAVIDSIDKVIKDIKDDVSLGEVAYQQALDRPHVVAPILRPTSPVKQLVNGKVLVSWGRNLEGDLKGYKIYLEGKVIKTSNPEDTSILLQDIQITQPIMISAYDNQADGYRDLVEGHESDVSVILEMPFAGEDTFICHDDSYWTKSATAREYKNVSWSTSGDGKFIDSTRLETFYIPGEKDKSSGLVSLKLQICTLGGDSRSDNMVITIHDYPVAEAGNDTTLAEGEIYITRNATAKNYTTIEWLTSGDGKFDNPGMLICSYTPGVLDIERKHVELTLKLNSSCSNIIDKLTINIIPAYDINGRVSTEKSVVDGAIVIAYNVNGERTEACSSVKTNEKGEFKFSNLPYGSYYLYAVANPHDYPNYYPTYWGSVKSWKEAKLHELNSDIYDVDIKLNRLDTLLPFGEGSIKGNCLYQDEPSEDELEVYQHNWFEDITNSAHKEGAACNHVVLLMNPDLSKVIGWTLSSSDGAFKFEQLPYGRYRIMGEKAGYENKISPLFELSKENPTNQNTSISVYSKNKILIAQVSDIGYVHDFVFPNPASEKILIRSDKLDDSSTFELKIVDQKGHTVLTRILERFNAFAYGPVDISKLKKGVYICNISGETGPTRSSKLIIF